MKNELSIVGLGSGSVDMVTLGAFEVMRAAEVVYIQTRFHGAYESLLARGVALEALDELYERAEDFDALNDAVAALVVDSAHKRRTVFAASGHGLAGHTASARIVAAAKTSGLGVTLYPGVSAEGAALAACMEAAAEGYVVHTGALEARFFNASRVNVITDVDSKVRAGEIKIALMHWLDDEATVFFVDAQGCAQRAALCDVDRLGGYGAGAAIVVPARALMEKERFDAQDLMAILRALRAPDGCPWDREQTHMSIRRNMMEECCEAMVAIASGDDEHLCEELGDVLLQVGLHATMAEEEGVFDFTGVVTGICRKLIRRHPHIFGDADAGTADEVLAHWERVKAIERNGAPKNPLAKVGEGLPALMRAQTLQKHLGVRDDGAAVRKDIDAALAALCAPGMDEAARERSAGLALWALCELLLMADVHAETSLHDACSDAITQNAPGRMGETPIIGSKVGV